MLRKTLITCVGVLIYTLGINNAVAQDLPSKMIYFVASESCPDGSNPAEDAAGRIIMVTTDTSQVGKTVGTAMLDQKDNTHTHTGTMKVNLPEHSVAGASSCCNGQATTKGDHSASIKTGASTTNLPFIQLLACAVN